MLVATLLAMSLVGRTLARRAANLSSSTRQLIVLLVGGLGLVLVVLVLPVDVETRNQLLGLVGLVVTALVTVSSTTLASNALAGLMLRGSGRYRPGDYLFVADHHGRVANQGLFHTELQTEDSDIVILPNSTLASSPVKVVRSTGTIVSIEVSLGYDVSRSTIKDALVTAAESVDLREPFVQLRQLGDFSVTYRIGGFLAQVSELPSVKSRLRAAVMDSLHASGIEIVSPTFMNQRRAEEPVIQPADMPAGEPYAPHAPPSRLAFPDAEAASESEQIRQDITDVESQLEELRRQRKQQADAELDEEIDRLSVRLAYLRSRVSEPG